MDPITLLFLAVFVYGTGDAVRAVRARVAARAARIEAWRRPPASARGSVAHGTTASGRPTDGVAGPAGHAPGTAPRHLHAPRHAARFGSRTAAAVTTYPALLWMLPASFYRGWRHGWLVGRHWRRSGGDVESAKRRAAGVATARGWHIPPWAVPDRAGVADEPTSAVSDDDPTAVVPATTADTAARVTAPPPGPAADRPPPRPGSTRSATADEVTDAELVARERIVPDPFADLVKDLYEADRIYRTTTPRGPTPMTSDITADLTPAASGDGGDYEAVNALAQQAAVVAEQMAQLASELEQVFTRHARAAESVGAEAAGLRVDAATQTDIAEVEAALSEARAVATKLTTAAEAIAEAAAALSKNLASRHGAIHDAVVDAPVRAAKTDFYTSA